MDFRDYRVCCERMECGYVLRSGVYIKLALLTFLYRQDR